MRARWRILIIFVMCCAIATFSNPTKQNPVVMGELIPPLNLENPGEDRLSLQKRVSRASSARADVSANTTTTGVTQPPSTQPPSSLPPETTVRPKVTASTTTTEVPTTTTEAPVVPSEPTSEEPQPEAPPATVAQTSDYDVCYKAAEARKGSKIAPNVARWIELVQKYFPGEIYKTCGVMACESSGDPNATGPRQPNGSYPKGLMQILNGPYDPEENLKLAASMRANRGWQPWSACL